MSIPTTEAGMNYHRAVEEFEAAVASVGSAEGALARAKAAKLKAHEMLHAAVQKLIASETKKALGPDGGK